jgi:LCP family protein required for cell wall assembly
VATSAPLPPHGGRPVTGTPNPAPRRPWWLRIVQWTLCGSLAALACSLAGAAAWIAIHATPAGPTFGWPFRVTARTNVLIMGLDRTVSDQNPNVVLPISRTDTLIAASFDPASHRIYLLSIPRDTRTGIPGHGMDRINAAHAYGGGALSMRTVQDFLGVRFPYYIEISARGLVHLIDAVGGVTIYVDKPLNYDDNWDGLHIHLKKGHLRLGGRDAVGYARFRHDALGDIGRIRRQQQLMNALMDELRKPRVLLHLGRILTVFHNDVTTNLGPDQLIALAWFGVRLPHTALVRETLPGRFAGYGGYWLADPAKDQDLVARMFYGIDGRLLDGATIEIVNASASRDAIADPLARLGALGLRVVRITTAPDAAETALVVHGGDPRVARVVAAALGVHRVVAGEAAGGASLTLVIGKDYAAAAAPPAIVDPPEPPAPPQPVKPRHGRAAPAPERSTH